MVKQDQQVHLQKDPPVQVRTQILLPLESLKTEQNTVRICFISC